MIRPLAALEKDAILNAIELTGDKIKAAQALGIGKTTVYRKFNEYRASGEVVSRVVLQAATLATIRNVGIDHVPVKLLTIPTTAAELQQASHRCPKCRALLILETRSRGL